MDLRKRALFLRPITKISGFTKVQGIQTASSRLQLEPAAEACTALGLSSYGLSLSLQNPQDLDLIDDFELCIVGKLTAKGEENLANLQMAQLAALARINSKRIPIITLYSDHMENAPVTLRNLYEDLLLMSNTVVYPCSSIQTNANQWVSIKAKQFIIEDPWQVKKSPFKETISEEIKIIWFGHESNLEYLARVLPNIDQSIPTNFAGELTILTSSYGLELAKEYLDSIERKSNKLKIRRVAWNSHKQPEQLEQELSRAQFSILPYDPNDSRKNGASHNRLVD